MRYVSTRGRAPALGFCDTLLAGLASDGGLYVPEQWPVLPSPAPAEPYARIAAGVVGAFAGDELEPALLERLCDEAYAGFRHPAICPLVQLDAGEWLLELFHGPTLAFKDLALQLVGRLFDHVLTQRDERITVLVATSGDTGSAAISGLASCRRAEIVVLYPEGRVSDVQRRQMTTVAAPNVHAVAVDGTFDDCQAIVKQLFGETAFRERVGLAAANSINWARVAAQVAYYVWATASLGGRELAFAVPTGNFGNVLSGWVARASGLPVERLVIGSNVNDLLPRLLASGRMEARGVVPTLSPSMDIQVSSNLERLLFELYGRDPERTARELTVFAETGALTLDPAPLAALRELFEAAAFDDEATLAVMRAEYARSGTLLDPHSAVGLAAGRARVGAREAPLVALATAHPAKFPEAVERATGISPALPPALADLRDHAERGERVSADAAAVQRLVERLTAR
ncbi:MAG: threonine synthase [Gaiellales bacterium]|jgi:threonine synthase|nr:threonine synthase [Gaiellales bacterium]